MSNGTAQVIAKIVDGAIAVYMVTGERDVIVAQVRAWESAGKTPDEITDALQSMRKQSEADAQQAIDDINGPGR